MLEFLLKKRASSVNIILLGKWGKRKNTEGNRYIKIS